MKSFSKTRIIKKIAVLCYKHYLQISNILYSLTFILLFPFKFMVVHWYTLLNRRLTRHKTISKMYELVTKRNFRTPVFRTENNHLALFFRSIINLLCWLLDEQLFSINHNLWPNFLSSYLLIECDNLKVCTVN